MPDRPLRLRLPKTCPACGTAGVVSPDVTVIADAAILTWCCKQCSHAWPITDAERQLAERRGGPTDRRRIVRKDRRKA